MSAPCSPAPCQVDSRSRRSVHRLVFFCQRRTPCTSLLPLRMRRSPLCSRRTRSGPSLPAPCLEGIWCSSSVRWLMPPCQPRTLRSLLLPLPKPRSPPCSRRTRSAPSLPAPCPPHSQCMLSCYRPARACPQRIACTWTIHPPRRQIRRSRVCTGHRRHCSSCLKDN